MDKKNNFYINNNILANEDDLTWKEVNCFYKPWAIIYSSYKKEYFDYFLLYSSFYGWSFCDDYYNIDLFTMDSLIERFLIFHNQIMEKRFNITVSKLNFTKYEDFIDTIISNLDESSSILVPGDLFKLYYFDDYKKRHHPHFFIIKGYDIKRKIFYALDSLHHEGGIKPLYKDFIIPFKVLYDMSKSFYKSLASYNYSFFWKIQKKDIDNNLSKYDVLFDMYNIIKEALEKDKIKEISYELINYINKDKSKLQLDNIFFQINFRNVFYKMLFNLLKGEIKEDILNNIEYNYNELTKNYNQTINVLSIEIMRATYRFDKIKNQLENFISITKNILYDIINSLDIEAIKTKMNEKSNKNNNIIIKNKNNATINEISNNSIQIVLSKDKIYNLWLLQDDAPQIYYKTNNKDFNFETNIISYSEKGQSFQNGIILKLENGHKIMFGLEMGKFINILYPELEKKSNLLKKEIDTTNIFLKVEYNNNIINFYYKEQKNDLWNNIYSYSIKTNLLPGIFSKTWDNINNTTDFIDINIY